MKNTRGVTLLELTIGLFLIGGVLAIYFQSIQSSKKKNEYYSEHFIASIMAGKVVEACFQETDINPYGIEALGLADSTGKPFKFSSLVTDGQTVFFKNPEISKENNPFLYAKFSNDFTLNIVTEDSSNSYFNVNTGFKWKAATGAGDFSFLCSFPGFALKREAISTFAFPEAQLEKKLVERFFEEKNKSLGTIIPSPTARAVALSTGRIYFSVSTLFSAPQFLNAFARAEKLAAEPHAPNSVKYFQATEAYFSIARDLLDLLLYLQPDMEILNKDIKAIEGMNLRTRSRLEVFLSKSGQGLDKMRQLFLICVNEAASRYKAQLQNSDSLKTQRMLIEKCLSMHRLMMVSIDFCADVFKSGDGKSIIRSEYYDFLKTVETFFADKDQSIMRLAIQEKKFAEASLLTRRYFTCDLVYRLFSGIAELKEKLPVPDPGTIDPDASVIGKASGNGTIAGAVTWARDQMEGGTGKGINANNGQQICNTDQAWNDWCLAFVNTAYNREIEELRVGSAITSYENWQRRGKINTSRKPPAGAILYTGPTPTNPHGHIFIASGKTSANGEAMVITTGSTGFDGVKETTLSECINWTGGSYLGWVLPDVKQR